VLHTIVCRTLPAGVFCGFVARKRATTAKFPRKTSARWARPATKLVAKTICAKQQMFPAARFRSGGDCRGKVQKKIFRVFRGYFFIFASKSAAKKFYLWENPQLRREKIHTERMVRPFGPEKNRRKMTENPFVPV
jgi:hypothetical protein